MGQGIQRVWFGGGEKWESILGVSAQASLGKMSCWDDILPKKGKYELGPLNACHRGR